MEKAAVYGVGCTGIGFILAAAIMNNVALLLCGVFLIAVAKCL